MERLKNPDRSMAEYKSDLLEKYRDAVNQLNMIMNNTLQNYRSQHQLFLAHCNNQIQVIQKILKRQYLMKTYIWFTLNIKCLKSH